MGMGWGRLMRKGGRRGGRSIRFVFCSSLRVRSASSVLIVFFFGGQAGGERREGMEGCLCVVAGVER